jgi:hypothetical protein
MRFSLPAVHELDLPQLLRSLGLEDELKAGILGCELCEEPVSPDTIYALFPQNDEIYVICTQPECVRAFLTSAFKPSRPASESMLDG